MNKITFFSITLLIGLLLFTLVINDVGISVILVAISSVKLWQFVLLLGLNALAFIISSYRWEVILKANGNIVSFKKVMAARLAGNSINYLTPSGMIFGEPFKAMVLSGESDIKFGSAMVSVVVEAAIYLSTVLLFVIIGILSFFSYSNISQKIFAIILGAAAVMIFIFYLFYSKMIKRSAEKTEKGFFTYIIDLLYLNKFSFVNKLKEKISRREKEIKIFFSLHKKAIIVAVLLSVAELVVTLSMHWLIIFFLGFSLDIGKLLGIFALMNISYLLPLPGSLGGLELSQIFAFSFFGLGGQVAAIAFSLINRIISLIFVTGGLLYLAYFQTKLLSKKFTAFLPKLKEKVKIFLRRI